MCSGKALCVCVRVFFCPLPLTLWWLMYIFNVGRGFVCRYRQPGTYIISMPPIVAMPMKAPLPNWFIWEQPWHTIHFRWWSHTHERAIVQKINKSLCSSCCKKKQNWQINVMLTQPVILICELYFLRCSRHSKIILIFSVHLFHLSLINHKYAIVLNLSKINKFQEQTLFVCNGKRLI